MARRAGVLVLCTIVMVLLSGCVGIVEATAPVRLTLYDLETRLPHGEVSCHLANSLLNQFKITLALRDAAPNTEYTFHMMWNGGWLNLGYLVTNRNGDLNFHVHQYLTSGNYFDVFFYLDRGGIKYITETFSFTIP